MSRKQYFLFFPCFPFTFVLSTNVSTTHNFRCEIIGAQPTLPNLLKFRSNLHAIGRKNLLAALDTMCNGNRVENIIIVAFYFIPDLSLEISQRTLLNTLILAVLITLIRSTRFIVNLLFSKSILSLVFWPLRTTRLESVLITGWRDKVSSGKWDYVSSIGKVSCITNRSLRCEKS